MLNKPPQYANNAFNYAITQIPPDSDSKYQEGPYVPMPESKVRNKWYEIFDIGVEARTGSNQATYTSPLTAGSIMRIHTDSPPEFWLVAVLCGTANGQLQIYCDADPVGYPIRLGNGGTARVPSRGRPFLTLRALSQSMTGTVIAIGGYDAGDIFMNPANQP